MDRIDMLLNILIAVREGQRTLASARDDIKSIADSVLITPDGRPHSTNIAVLRHEGFHTYPGERDGFGWLTGVLHIPHHGHVVFG